MRMRKVNLSKAEPITKFDEGLWGSLLESITVYAKDDIRVKFKA